MNYIKFRIFVVFLSSIFFLSSWQGVKDNRKYFQMVALSKPVEFSFQ